MDKKTAEKIIAEFTKKLEDFIANPHPIDEPIVTDAECYMKEAADRTLEVYKVHDQRNFSEANLVWMLDRAEHLSVSVKEFKTEILPHMIKEIDGQTERQIWVRKVEKAGYKVCTRCGGAGGYEGWPGYTCWDCMGKGYIK